MTSHRGTLPPTRLRTPPSLVQWASMGKAAFQLSVALGALVAASPAWAAGSTPIPEPTDLTLLAMGLAGLIIGRRAAKKPPKD